MCYIQYCFFPSGAGVDNVLVRFLLIKQIIKDANLICIAFRVGHPQIFWELWMSLSNMSRIISNLYVYPFNPQLLIKTLVEHHDKKLMRSKELLYMDRYFQMDGCISVLVRLLFNWNMSIYSKYKLFIFSILCLLVSICYNFSL